MKTHISSFYFANANAVYGGWTRNAVGVEHLSSHTMNLTIDATPIVPAAPLETTTGSREGTICTHNEKSEKYKDCFDRVTRNAKPVDRSKEYREYFDRIAQGVAKGAPRSRKYKENFDRTTRCSGHVQPSNVSKARPASVSFDPPMTTTTHTTYPIIFLTTWRRIDTSSSVLCSCGCPQNCIDQASQI